LRPFGTSVTRPRTATAATADPARNAVFEPAPCQTRPKTTLAGKRCEADEAVHPAERPAAHFRADEVGDEGLLRSLRQRVVERIDADERDERRRRRDVREARVAGRVERPRGEDQPLPPEAVRQPAAPRREEGLHAVRERPDEGEPYGGDPDFLRFQEEERVGRSREGEEREDA
jgi:hypothetical protein